MFYSRYKIHILRSILYLYRSSSYKVNELSAAKYSRELVESGKYENWERKKLFVADNTREGGNETFSMVLPPPNVTGKLHLGHALGVVWTDAIVRAARSKGNNVLWVPGTDHAGIGTQVVVEKHIKQKYGLDRYSIGREKFTEEIWKWKNENGNRILQQLRALGASLDWSREVFTMDERQANAVTTAFIRLFEKGLIYRVQSLVNWSCALKSTISDVEVDKLHIENPREIRVPGYDEPVKFGLIMNFAYKIYDSEDEIIVSTTRPETILGDVAIAVHPSDSRYTKYHGRRCIHPFTNETIPLIVNDFVDINFGTGAVKITPAHDRTDYDVGKTHGLKSIQVIDEDGLITFENSEFHKLNRFECRKKIVGRLNDLGLMRSEIPHAVTLPICSRSGDIVEFLPKEQWFLSCKDLAKKALKAVENGSLVFEPSRFENVWRNWLENEKDWCISRQLWWGHKIPAYKCSMGNSSYWFAAYTKDEAVKHATDHFNCNTNDLVCEQDTDVLDTWFSSGIYPFSSLGWPEETKDLEKYYPLTAMMTGHDILLFWVYRMVILGIELTNSLPFSKVLLHGVICDSYGAKMSKSRGNVIDPEDIIKGISLEDLDTKSKDMHRNGLINDEELQKSLAYHKSNFPDGIPECGVDALRFTLCSRNVRSHYVHFDVEECFTNAKFCNKIWQSVKYSQIAYAKYAQLDGNHRQCSKKDLTTFDRWILSRLVTLILNVEKGFENYQLDLATNSLKHFFYNELCDVYLETTKPSYESNDLVKSVAHAHTLATVLNAGLRCLAPFMIYLSEELIPKVPNVANNCIYTFNDSDKDIYSIPSSDDFIEFIDIDLENNVSMYLDTLSLVRQLKNIYNISYKIKSDLYIECDNKKFATFLNENSDVFSFISRSGKILSKSVDTKRNIVSGILNKSCSVSIELPDESMQFIDKARKRLNKKFEKLQKSILRLENLMANSKYEASTPEEIKKNNKEKLNNLTKELSQLKKVSVRLGI